MHFQKNLFALSCTVKKPFPLCTVKKAFPNIMHWLEISFLISCTVRKYLSLYHALPEIIFPYIMHYQ